MIAIPLFLTIGSGFLSSYLFSSFPNSVWERHPRNSVSLLTSHATAEGAKQSFAKVGSQTEFGNQKNQTQVLAAIFAYQLLVRYNYRRGNRNGQLPWILDTL